MRELHTLKLQTLKINKDKIIDKIKCEYYQQIRQVRKNFILNCREIADPAFYLPKSYFLNYDYDDPSPDESPVDCYPVESKGKKYKHEIYGTVINNEYYEVSVERYKGKVRIESLKEDYEDGVRTKWLDESYLSKFQEPDDMPF